MPIPILKQSGFTYQILTDCINHAITKDIFPDSVKTVHITTAHKKDDPNDKENYRAVSVLPYQRSLKD